MAIIKIEAARPGLLYHKPEPDAEPFKKPGDAVAVGDTLALVELMKSFVPITAEVVGRFRGFLIGDGEDLEPGVAFCEIEE